MQDKRKQLRKKLKTCGKDIDCILDTLEQYGIQHGPDGLGEALRDSSIIQQLSSLRLDPVDVAVRLDKRSSPILDSVALDLIRAVRGEKPIKPSKRIMATQKQRLSPTKRILPLLLVLLVLSGILLHYYGPPRMWRNDSEYTHPGGVNTTEPAPKEPPPPWCSDCSVVRIGPYRIMANNSYLIIDTTSDNISMIAMRGENVSEKIILAQDMAGSVADENYIGPLLLFANKTYMRAVYQLEPILSFLQDHGNTAEIIVYNMEKLCILNLTSTDPIELQLGECEDINILSLFGRSELMINALRNLTLDEAIDVYNRVRPNFSTLTPVDVAKGLLYWLYLNTEYNYSKMFSFGNVDILSPSEFLEKKTGICGDYAVFTSAVMLGYKHEREVENMNVSIIIMRIGLSLHAATAITVNGQTYILDQVPPLYTPDVYTRNRNITSDIAVYNIQFDSNGEPIIKGYIVPLYEFREHGLLAKPEGSP